MFSSLIGAIPPREAQDRAGRWAKDERRRDLGRLSVAFEGNM